MRLAFLLRPLALLVVSAVLCVDAHAQKMGAAPATTVPDPMLGVAYGEIYTDAAYLQ